jgi:hypothetical protein
MKNNPFDRLADCAKMFKEPKSFFTSKKADKPIRKSSQIATPIPCALQSIYGSPPALAPAIAPAAPTPPATAPVLISAETAITQMFQKPAPHEGTLLSYFREFLMKKYAPEDGCPDSWTQPEAMQYINKRVVADGGVAWWQKSNGKGNGKRNPDGTPADFGDGGRTIEAFRNEKWEGCFDLIGDNSSGPFTLNIQKFMDYTGPTKCHGFSKEIIAEVKERSNGKCELCGHKGRIEIDHFTPKEKGGKSILSNANALCGRCNDRKCNIDPKEFMKKELSRQLNYWKNMGMEEELQEILQEITN